MYFVCDVWISCGVVSQVVFSDGKLIYKTDVSNATNPTNILYAFFTFEYDVIVVDKDIKVILFDGARRNGVYWYQYLFKFR